MRTRITASSPCWWPSRSTGAGLIVYALGRHRVERGASAGRPGDRGVQPASRPASTPTPSALRLGHSACWRCSSHATSPTTTSCWSAGATARPATGPASTWSSRRTRPSRPPSRRTSTTGGTSVLESRFGELLVTIQPVQGRRHLGRTRRGDVPRRRQADLNGHACRTYAIVALLSLLVITGLAAWQSGRLLAPLRDAARDRRGDHRHRPVPAAPGDGQRRHHRAHPHLQRHARPAGGGLRRPAPVPRRRRPRAEDAADRAARPPRAARPRRPAGGRRDPDAAARRGRPDVPAGRRPDPAGQDRAAGLPRHPQPVDLERLTDTVLAKARGLGDRDWRLDGAGEATSRWTSSGSPRRCCSSPTTPSSTPAPATRSRSARRATAARVRLWVRDTGPGVPAADRERDLRALRPRRRAPTSDEGFGLGLSIVRAIAAGPRRDGHRRGRRPAGARFVITLPLTRPDDATTQGGSHGPHPDRRGRGADRVVRRQGAARRGPPDHRRRRRARGPRPRAERRLRPGGARHRTARPRRLRACSTSCAPRARGSR